MPKSKDSKKANQEKTPLDNHNLSVKGSYDFEWGVDANTYDNSDLYDYGYFDGYESVLTAKDIYSIHEVDAEEVRTRWNGALVKFNTHYYILKGLSVFNGPYSTVVTPGSNTSSRLNNEDFDYLNHTGTVIDVAGHPNYKNQWCVNVLWSDGRISYENILDLQMIQPAKGDTGQN